MHLAGLLVWSNELARLRYALRKAVQSDSFNQFNFLLDVTMRTNQTSRNVRTMLASVLS